MRSDEVKPIGGEFWFDIDIFEKEVNRNFDGALLSGGQAAIKYILNNILIEESQVVLMPAYLCPSILQWFSKANVNVVFYKINTDLSIDLDYLKLCIDKYDVKAVFFINYFGFYHDDRTIELLNALKNNGITLIEDAVQMLWTKRSEKFIGDYVFNSLRKFAPIDGSIVLGGENRLETTEKDEYLNLVYRARMNKTLYECFGIGEEKDFLSIFDKAEEVYYERKDFTMIDENSLSLLSRLDTEFISNKRKENYIYLSEKLKENGIRCLFKYRNSATPIGLPIYVENRDVIRKELRKKSIYCPVHWDIRQEYWVREFNESYYIADRILTLPIDQRYSKADMNRLIKELVILIKSFD